MPRSFIKVIQHLSVASQQTFRVLNERRAIDLFVLPITLASFVGKTSKYADSCFRTRHFRPWFRSFHEPISFQRNLVMEDTLIFDHDIPSFWPVFEEFFVFFRNCSRSCSFVWAYIGRGTFKDNPHLWAIRITCRSLYRIPDFF